MTSRQDYCVYFIDDANKIAANVGMALVNGDNPTIAQNMGIGANPSSGPNSADPTAWYGGMPTTPEWMAEIAALTTTVPTPSGGWPVTAPGGVSVSEADVKAASAHIYLHTVTTFDGTAPDQHACLAAALSAQGLQIYVPPWGDGL